MLSENAALDSTVLRAVVEQDFGRQPGELRFHPLGEDSWSYRLGELWVSVRRDVQGHVGSAYEAAFGLACSGLDFVLAPQPWSDGAIVRMVQGLPVVVFPFVDVAPIRPDQPLTEHEAGAIERIVSRLHGSPRPHGLPAEDFTLPFGAALDRSLTAARAATSAGPFSRRFTELVHDNADRLARLRAERDDIANQLRRREMRFVVTHGDLNGENVLRGRDGLTVADWGLTRWAPPERDWYHLNRTLGMSPRGDHAVLRYYDLRWQLSEIAEYAGVFTSPHEDGDDERGMWRRLTRYLPQHTTGTRTH